MWRATSLILVLVASTLGGEHGGIRPDKALTLKNLLSDHSWSTGISSLVAIGSSTSCSTIFSCADCNTAQICQPNVNGSYTPLRSIPCPAATPYCQASTGTCGVKPDDSCGKTDTFTCLDNGHFPDANCLMYHVCEGYVPHKFQCDVPGQKYNADSQRCETTEDCATFTCEATGTKVPSSLYPSYFGFCSNTTSPPVVISKCEGINQLNSTSQLCEPICEKEGLLEDVESCTSYYKCSYMWVNDLTKFMIRERLQCPANTGFDPSNFMCISLNDYPKCQSKIKQNSQS